MKERTMFGPSHFLLCSIFLLCILGMAQGKVHFYDFVLEESNFTRLCSTKSLLTVNNSFPGPIIRVHKGDTVFVNVHNHGYYGVTLHWHGVKQPRNPWSDGPEYITQCGIAPGTNYTYKVIFSTEEGTLWWHAHSDWTLSSVHGAIIILPPKGKAYPFPQPYGEEVLVLASWYEANVYEELNEDLDIGGDVPKADAYVINGQTGPFFKCGEETVHRIYVDYGKTYLLRIVNAAVNSELFFAIASHNVTVVGMDGNYLKPFSTPNVMISPGQTMNILLTANQAPGHYYIAARQFITLGNADVHNSTAAVLEYRGSSYPAPSSPVFPASLPVHRDIATGNGFISRLRSLADKHHPVSVPLDITTRMFIVDSMKEVSCPNHSCPTKDGNRITFSLNNITFWNPSTDILLAYYRNISGIYSADFPDMPSVFFNFTGYNLTYNSTTTGTKVKVLNYNENVEIVFQDSNEMDAAQNHPMHLHGHSFYVVGSGLGNFDNETHPKSYNLLDPPELNTIRIPKMGWLTIRFHAKNPGVWLLHCHLSKHLTLGMQMAFIVRDGGTPETSILEPPAYLPPCDQSFTRYIRQFDDSNGRKFYNG